MPESQPRFISIAAKAAVCHTVTYFLMGALAYHFLHYAELIAQPCSGMKPMSDPMVRGGVLFQPLRAVLFTTVFYPFRDRLFGTKNGWLLMGWMLVALGIFGTFAASPGSTEGFIYSTVAVRQQLLGLLEIIPQALLLSALLCYWVNNPGKKWFSWLMGAAMFIVLSFGTLAFMMTPR